MNSNLPESVSKSKEKASKKKKTMKGPDEPDGFSALLMMIATCKNAELEAR
jgi:hypothetical protein